MSTAEQLSVETIDKAIKQYLSDTQLSLEKLQLLKNKSFESLDSSLYSIIKHSDGYLEEDTAKIIEKKNRDINAILDYLIDCFENHNK